MSLGEHLVELRKRLMRSALAVLAFTIAGFWAAEYVWDALRTPVVAIAERHQAIINYPSISGAFDIRIQIALVIGIVASSPIWLYQLFAFLVPGLNQREKRYTFGFFFSAVPLFLAGCVAGWWVFPHIVEVLASFVPEEDASFFDAKYYLDFVLKLVLATGIAFVLPVFLVLLNFIGILRGTTILKGWRWAILAITIFTAIATPAADVIAMFLLAIPMIALYFAAVAIAIARDRITDRRQADALPA